MKANTLTVSAAAAATDLQRFSMFISTGKNAIAVFL